MRSFIVPLLLSCAGAVGAGLPPAGPGAPATSQPATNHLEILCDDGFEYFGHQAIYRGNVRASDGDMTLLCEVLTVNFQTHPPPAAPSGQAEPAATNAPARRSRIDSIIAEQNVVLTNRDSRATGERAVYTATNELVVLTGARVRLDTVQGAMEGTQIILNRQTGRMVAPGRVKMWLWPDAFGEQGVGLLGTNTLRLPGGSPAPPAAPKP